MMIVQERQAPAQSHAAQALGVHPAGIPSEAEEQEDHDRAAQPDVAREDRSAAGRDLFDGVPFGRVVYGGPAERDVWDGDRLAYGVDFQWN